MDGIVFVAGLVVGITAAALWKRGAGTTPGIGLSLGLIVLCAWYVFA